ncbi:MAG: DUF4157 domain-containing protein, partial [Proteobacteria bacterium]|nr:DUF4157 domain-containing protein [Pseudomonadota bacterium]
MKKQAARQQEEELQRKRAQRYAEYVSASHSWAAASPRLPTPPSSEQTLSRQREEESRRAWSMTDGQAFALGRGLGNSAARSILDTSNDGFSARHEAPGEALTASLLARDAANEIARDADEAPIVVKDEAAGIDVAYDPGGGAPDVDLKQVKESMGSGTPLDAGTREYMEWRFGLNLGNVRIHTGPKADALSKALMAHAFALGADVNFAAGQYKPGTKQGDFLLAHELTHVVQAGHATEQPAAKTTELGARKSSSVSEPDDAIEVEADQVAGEVVSVGRSEFAKAKREGSVGASASVESAHAPSPTARKAARLPAAGGGAGAARKIARDGGNTPDEEGDEEQESVPDPDVQSEGEVELEPGEGPPPVDTTLPDQSIEPSDGNIAPGSPSGATFGPGPAPVSGTPAPVSAPTQNVTPANDATINGGLGSTQGTSIPAAEQLFTAAVGAEPNQHQAQIEAGIAQIGTALSATQAQVRSSAASLGASLLSEADAHIGAVQTAAASAAALISSAYADARTATSAAAEAARGQVDVYTASAKGEIEAAGADAITRAQTALSESATAFAAEVETSIAAAESEATTTVAAMRKAGRDAAADALKVAEEWAVKYEGRTGATDLDKKRAKARADAARSVGQNTADELIKKGNAAADEFSGLHANIRPTIETLLQPVLDTLGQQSGDIAQTVASTTASLMEQVDEAGAPVVQSINEAEAAALTSLEAQEASMLRLAAESATAVQDQLRTAAEAGRASLEAAGEELAESLAAEAAALQSQLAGQDAPASEDLSLEIDALIETILNSDAADALHDLYRQLSANLSDLANQGVQSIDQLVSSAMELAARFVDQFSGGLQQSLESLSNTLGEFVSGALGQFEELVNQVMAAAEAVIREARTQIGGKVDGMLGDLRQAASGLAEVLSEALGGLPAQIKEQADEAASKIKSGFWGRLGAVLLVIVIVVALVALVIFAGPALLAALGVAAGTLLAKVLIGVAIGFIAAAAFAMFKDAFGGTFSITNWRNYLKSGIVGAIVGAVTVLTGGMSVWAQGALMGVVDYFTNLSLDQIGWLDGVGQGFFHDFSFLDLGITVVLSMGLNRLFSGGKGKSGLGARISSFFKGKMPSWNSFQTMVGQHINPTLRSVGMKALNSTWISVLRNMPSTLTTKWLKSTVKD